MSLFNFLCTFALTFLTFCKMTKSEMTHFWHYLLIVSMPFAKEGKILIQILSNIKNYNAKDLVREFLNKGCNVDSVYKLLQMLQVTGLDDCHSGSAR